MGMKKVNTTAYHPDRRVDQTIQSYFDRHAGKNHRQRGIQDWDTRLLYVLFAYRCSMQSSTIESPFFLLYGQDPKLPTETTLTARIPRAEVDKEKVVQGPTEAWGLAQS